MNMAYSSPFRLWFSVQFSVKMVVLSISKLTEFKFECKAVEANSNGSTQRGEAADRKSPLFLFSPFPVEYLSIKLNAATSKYYLIQKNNANSSSDNRQKLPRTEAVVIFAKVGITKKYP